MPMGRVFSSRLSLATRGVSVPSHRIRNTRALRDDLLVWKSFLGQCNGRTCCPNDECDNLDINIFTFGQAMVGRSVALGMAGSGFVQEFDVIGTIPYCCNAGVVRRVIDK